MNNQKIIVGVAGEIGAGKDTVTGYITERYGAKYYRYSMILKDILKRLHLPYDRIRLADLAEALRAYFGENILSQTLVKDAENDLDADIIVFDGIRKVGELEYLKTLPHFRFLFVDADMQVRYERLRKRGEKSDDLTKTMEEFMKDHEHAADNVIPKLKSHAHAVIDNNGTLEELHAQVDRAIEKFRNKAE